jgi:diguanylate cyclase (GGDEF)-like protein/PAS domain S-box-containing protein
MSGTERPAAENCMKWFTAHARRSLLVRILLANLVVAGISVVSLTALFLFSYRAEFERQQELRARTLAQFVARQCEVPALIGDRGAMEKVAATALSGEDVLAVSIRYRGGPPQEVLAKNQEARASDSEFLDIVGNAWVEASEEIRPVQSGLLDWDNASRQPESIGRVRLRISLRKEQALFRGTVQQSLGLMGGLLLLIPSVQFFRIRRLLRPLELLVAFTKRIGRGDLSERSPVDQVDEIADVAIAFNQMLDRLGRTTVSRDYVDNIIRSMAECLIVVGADGKIRTINEATLGLLGYDENDLVGQPASVVAGDDLPMSMRTISATERIWRRRDGKPIPVLFSSAALRRSGAAEEGMVWIAQDITDQKRVREELIAARERYALAVAGANDGIWDWNVVEDEVYYSPRWKRMLGYDDHDLPGRIGSWFGLLHPEDRPRVEHEMEAHRIGVSEMFESEHRMRHRDGTYHWMLNRGLAVRGPDGAATRIAGSQTDITQNKVSDPLTGLPNRVRFTERLGVAFSKRRRDPDYRSVVLFLDLDRFKMINDSLGHLAGDQLLIGIADRLRAGVQTENCQCEYTIARLSGDEFAILLENLKEKDAGAAGAQVGARLIRDLSAPFMIGGREIFTSVSIGVAPDTGDYQSPAEILRDADTAMYRAKAAGKSRYEVFDSDMRAQAVLRLELDTDLRKAVERNQFVVYYQPKFSIPGELLMGFEALVRWSHPKRGLVLPNEFIPVVEETGLILEMGAFVLRAACRQMRDWQLRYPQAAHAIVSVNISPRQFLVPDLPQLVADILRETELAPRSLALEITETVLMGDTEKAVVTLQQLRALGVGLRIDDFGTGYSSLNYLHRFPFDTVKIDRSFVSNLDNDEGAAIEKAIISLAENLGMKVVAEGVETSRQMRILTRLGCHGGQGYYYSRPVPANVAEVILSSSLESSPEPPETWAAPILSAMPGNAPVMPDLANETRMSIANIPSRRL